MTFLRALYQLMWADFLERTRRYSFFVILVLTMLMAYFYLPAQDAPYRTLNFGQYRGMYNSAWIGMQIALLASFWLPIVGFYLVKDCIERDERTGVGQIIAATPVRTAFYMIGKMLSNFAVLASMVGVTAIVAGAMQFMRGEDAHLDLWALLSPFLFLTLPAIALPSALAVLFETLRWLRGSLGNAIYFILSMIMLFAGQGKASNSIKLFDPYGASILFTQIQPQLTKHFPDFDGEASVGLTLNDASHMHLFVWNGMHWTGEIILQRLFWIGISLAIVLLASLFFSRFDPARAPSRSKRSTSEMSGHKDHTLLEATSSSQVAITPLACPPSRMRWMVVLVNEVRLLLKGLSIWWYMVILGLNLLMALLPLGVSQYVFYPLASIWPLFLWSGLGSREKRFGTHQLMFSMPHPLTRQLPLHWVAGVACTLLMTGGLIVRLALTGEISELLMLGVVSLFVPSLAMASGVWVGNSRLFEVLYLFWWYIGPVNHIPPLDYLEMGSPMRTLQLSFILLCTTLLLLAVAFTGRKRQMSAQ